MNKASEVSTRQMVGWSNHAPDNFRNVECDVKNMTAVNVRKLSEAFATPNIPYSNATVVAPADKAHGSRIK